MFFGRVLLLVVRCLLGCFRWLLGSYYGVLGGCLGVLADRVFCSVVTKVVLGGCQVFTGLFWLVARYFLTVSNKVSH